MTLAAPVPRSRGCLGAERTGQSPPTLQAARCEVAAYPASPSPWLLPPPCLDLMPAWQLMGLEKPSPSASGPLLWRQYYDYDGEEQG